MLPRERGVSCQLTIDFHLALRRDSGKRGRIGGHLALVGALTGQANLVQVNMGGV